MTGVISFVRTHAVTSLMRAPRRIPRATHFCSIVVGLLITTTMDARGEQETHPEDLLLAPGSICSHGPTLIEPNRDNTFQQTPIKFTKLNTNFMALPALTFNYGTPPVTLLDTGKPGTEKTIQGNINRVQTPTAPTPTVQIDGGDWNGTYHLRQFHFHAPAEHVSIKDIEYPMEVHLVHTLPDPNYPNDPDRFLAVLVIGAWMTDNSHTGFYPPLPQPPVDPALVKLFTYLPKNNKPVGDSVTMHLDSFDPIKLLPPNVNGHTYRYTGTLTTPNFNKPIRWIVYRNPVGLGTNQIKKFTDLWLVDGVAQGNSRRLQKPRVNNAGVPLRIVDTNDPEAMLIAPQPAP